MPTPPRLLHTVLDTTDTRRLAEFYRRLLGLAYRPGDEPGGEAAPEWLVLVDDSGRRVLALQRVEALPPSTWPGTDVPMQLHLDFTVPDLDSLAAAHDHAVDLGARELLDRTADADEPLWVLADPAGHPFCVFVA